MKHNITLRSTKEGIKIECSCKQDIPGVYYTEKKANRAAQAHIQMNTPVGSLEVVEAKVDVIAKKSKTFAEFEKAVLNNSDLRNSVPARVLRQCIQQNETAMLLD